MFFYFRYFEFYKQKNRKMIKIISFVCILLLALAYSVNMSPIVDKSTDVQSQNEELSKMLRLYQEYLENEVLDDDSDKSDEEAFKRSSPRRIFIGKRFNPFRSEDDGESYADKRNNIHRIFIGKRRGTGHEIKRIFIG